MDQAFETKYHDVETSHWWFKSRRKYLLDLLADAPRDSRILDIGSSSGVFLKDLELQGFDIDKLYGIDISDSAIANCKANGIKNAFVMDAQNITLSEKFDIIVASDCLEHLQNDRLAIRNWKNLLKSGGLLYVFVPAYKSLWSYHDDINMHFRRYTKRELKSKLTAEDFSIKKSSYWNFTLFIPIFAFRKINAGSKKNRNSESDLSIQNSFLNNVLFKLLSFENQLLRYVNFPFGISTFCIAKKE